MHKKVLASKEIIQYKFLFHRLFPDGVDLVLDCICGEDANKGYNLLKPLGRYVLYGKWHDNILSANIKY